MEEEAGRQVLMELESTVGSSTFKQDQPQWSDRPPRWPFFHPQLHLFTSLDQLVTPCSVQSVTISIHHIYNFIIHQRFLSLASINVNQVPSMRR